MMLNSTPETERLYRAISAIRKENKELASLLSMLVAEVIISERRRQKEEQDE